MKKLSVVILIIIFSCSDDQAPQTPEDFGKIIYSGFSEQDYNYIEPLEIVVEDTSQFYSGSLKNDFIQIFSDSTSHLLFKERYKAFRELLENGKQIGIDWKSIEYDKFEYESVYSKKLEHNFIVGKLYFKYLDRSYYIKVYTVKLKNGWKNFKMHSVVDVKEENRRIEEEENKPYFPRLMLFTNGNWEYKSKSKGTFKNFEITLKNFSKYDYDYIKFRFTLFEKKEDEYRRAIFSKVYERNQKIFSKDIVRFKIPDMVNFYAGFDISNDNNFDFEAEVLEAKPRPN